MTLRMRTVSTLATLLVAGCGDDAPPPAPTILNPGGPSTDDSGDGTEPDEDSPADSQSGPDGQGGLSALFMDPALVGEDCTKLRRDHIIWPVHMGGSGFGALLNFDVNTGYLIASCGGIEFQGLPTENDWNLFAVTDNGTVFYGIEYFIGAPRGTAILNPDRIATCGLDCFTYDGYQDNDTVLEGVGGHFVYNPSNNTILWPQTGTVADEDGNFLDRDDDASTASVLAINDSGRRLIANMEYAYMVGFGVVMPGEAPQTDGVLYPSAPDDIVHYVAGPADDFYVALLSEDETYTSLIYVASDGQTTDLGRFAADFNPNLVTEGLGGRLMPHDGCLYTAVVDQADQSRVLIRRCTDGTWEEFVRTPNCTPIKSLCIVGSG